MCAAQAYYLERQIEEDLTLFPKENLQEIHYQDFDQELIRCLGGWAGVQRRVGASMPEFQHDNPDLLSQVEHEELNRLVEKYPFKKELFV